ncbi:MAG: mechanosensitive ion channel [Cloacibacillus sp.]
MRSAAFKKFIFAMILIPFLLIFPHAATATGSLDDLNDEIARYQTEPLKRAREIEDGLRKMREVEDGLARQYDVKMSDVLAYEYELEWLVDTYYSLYFLQKRGDAKSTFVLDDAEINELAAKKPPYTFSFYLGVANDMATCTEKFMENREAFVSGQKHVQQLSEERKDAERAYRRCREKTLLSSENRIKYNFELLVIKAKLERSVADHTFYELAMKISESRGAEMKEKIDMLAPILKNIRANIKMDNETFEYLDSIAFGKMRNIHNITEMLSHKFNELSETRRYAERPSPFLRYSILTEQTLVERELLFVLDLAEEWAAMRLVWRSMGEMFTEKLTAQEQRAVKARIEEQTSQAQNALEYANKEMQKIRSAEDEVQNRFGDGDIAPFSKEARERDLFMENLEARKERYLSYIVMLGAMRSHYETLKEETARILGEGSAKEDITDTWGENISSMLDYELWNVGDYPITVEKIALAALIFAVSLCVTLLFVKLLKIHLKKSRSMSRHSALLVQNLVFYFGVAVSFLLTLWMLHIPLTAFAFMGGAVAIAIGLGTQKIMGDTLSGLLLLFQKKLRIGDEVIIGDVQGVVHEITLQNTVLLCEETKHMIIPNSRVLESSVLNLTLDSTVMRTELNIPVSYDADIELALLLIKRVLEDNKSVLKQPPFRILYSDAGDGRIVIKARFFIDIKVTFESIIKSALRLSIINLFKEHGLSLNTPKNDVRIVS